MLVTQTVTKLFAFREPEAGSPLSKYRISEYVHRQLDNKNVNAVNNIKT